jgi:hypothetical protein
MSERTTYPRVEDESNVDKKYYPRIPADVEAEAAAERDWAERDHAALIGKSALKPPTVSNESHLIVTVEQS